MASSSEETRIGWLRGGRHDVGEAEEDVGGVAAAERVMTMLSRFLRGRKLAGIESHVLRPMMTALTACGGACRLSASALGLRGTEEGGG